jgi:mono/diheme cytochrome c family protein
MSRPLTIRNSGLSMLAVVVCGLLLFQAGCGSARRGEPIVGPLEITRAQEQGRVVFARHCHKCHVGGEAGLGPAINDKPLPAFLMRFQVRNGLGVMPAFAKDRISEAELDQLIAYLKALRRHEGRP